MNGHMMYGHNLLRNTQPKILHKSFERASKAGIFNNNEPDEGELLKVGDIVERVPRSFYGYDKDGPTKHEPLKGEVIFVHPKGRFHTVEFTFHSIWGERKLRACFFGVRAG